MWSSYGYLNLHWRMSPSLQLQRAGTSIPIMKKPQKIVERKKRDWFTCENQVVTSLCGNCLHWREAQMCCFSVWKCQRKLVWSVPAVCSFKSIILGVEHCETSIKHATFRQRKPADILESLCFSKTWRKCAALAHRILNQSKKKGPEQGARELN